MGCLLCAVCWGYGTRMNGDPSRPHGPESRIIGKSVRDIVRARRDDSGAPMVTA